jgi:DnaJ family protein A protein 2
MDDINPYQLLGVPEDATVEQVKESYKQLALKHHPDKGGNPETFKISKNRQRHLSLI